jgi:Tfp pilus assembly protein PilF
VPRQPDRTADLYQRGQYRQAILLFEQLRHAPGVPDSAKLAMLFDIGMCNLKLNRYATAIIYFEQYLAMPGADVVKGEGADIPSTSRAAEEGR